VVSEHCQREGPSSRIATGTAQALQVVMETWKKFDFFQYTFPAALEARGFDEAGTDGLADYLYRDDGFKIWRAMEEYVSGAVNAVYADDAAVKADPSVQAWCAESIDPERADIPGFPSAIETRELLAQVLTILIWNVSAAHSVVNYSQYDYNAYVPNRPPALFKEMPDTDGDIDEKFIAEALPNELITHFQLVSSYVLSLPPGRPLTTVDAMAEVAPEAHKQFQARLAEISEDLKARNAALVAAGKPPYTYLLPENVASSVAI